MTLNTVTIRGVNFIGEKFSVRQAGYSVELKVDGKYYSIQHRYESYAKSMIKKLKNQFSFITIS